eukprot:Clim_evm156s157 gene=Clim_evmTU156s157
MSANTALLAPKEADILKMLAAEVHIGTPNCGFQFEKYVYSRSASGHHIINFRKTWEKLLLAARVLAAIENPQDIVALGSRTIAQRAILKFAAHTGCTAVAGRYTPGTFTNYIQRAYKEPRILVVHDPYVDHQPIVEASYVNIPVIAFCDSDTPMKNVDIAIPCNNKSVHSTGLMWWFLAREVLRLRGTLNRNTEWDIMPDLYFYRSPDEQQKDEEEQKAKNAEEPTAYDETVAAATGFDAAAGYTAPADENWGGDGADWGATTGGASEQWGAAQ